MNWHTIESVLSWAAIAACFFYILKTRRMSRMLDKQRAELENTKLKLAHRALTDAVDLLEDVSADLPEYRAEEHAARFEAIEEARDATAPWADWESPRPLE